MVEAAAANQHGGPFRAHVVVFPFPAQAHIRPVILLSKSLAAVYDVAVTFVSTTPELDSTRRGFEGEDERFQDHRNNIRLVSVDMQPVEYGVSTILNFQKLQRATSNLRDTFAELMKELRDSSTSNGTSCDPSAPPSTDHNFGPPLCIISDMWLGWAQDIADEFKVPRYCFSPSPTHFVSLVFGLPELNAQGRILAQLDGKPYTIPGFPPILPFDLPRLLLGDQKQLEILLYHGECLCRAAGVLVNSVFELESSIIKGLQDMHPSSCKGNQVLSMLFGKETQQS